MSNQQQHHRFPWMNAYPSPYYPPYGFPFSFYYPAPPNSNIGFDWFEKNQLIISNERNENDVKLEAKDQVQDKIIEEQLKEHEKYKKQTSKENHQIFKCSKKSQLKNKKKKKDQVFKITQRKKKEKIIQRLGRNANSNIFKSFLKTILNSKNQQKLKQDFLKIKKINNFQIQFDRFLDFLRKETPDYRQYINLNEFTSNYFGNSETNQIFRILFNYFKKKQGYSYVLTGSSRSKFKEEGKKQFLETLRYMNLHESFEEDPSNEQI